MFQYEVFYSLRCAEKFAVSDLLKFNFTKNEAYKRSEISRTLYVVVLHTSFLANQENKCAQTTLQFQSFMEITQFLECKLMFYINVQNCLPFQIFEKKKNSAKRRTELTLTQRVISEKKSYILLCELLLCNQCLDKLLYRSSLSAMSQRFIRIGSNLADVLRPSFTDKSTKDIFL